MILCFYSVVDCNSNGVPIAASTRVSALNIVADLLRKLDVSLIWISEVGCSISFSWLDDIKQPSFHKPNSTFN